jgi:ParB-like chromosome segregation protein Spo0J
MKIESVKISQLKANPNNPRIIKDDKFEKLVRSIKEFPKMLEIRPIVVNDDMIVLGGNMRLKACKEAGLKEVPVIKASDLTEDEQRQFIIKDNVSGGEWEWEMLNNDWDVEQLDDWGLDIPNFDINNETEQKDLSSTIESLYRIEVICKDEEHQENSYNKLIEQGYECRLLTL